MMSIEEFRELHAEMAKAKPKLFLLIPPDPPASEQKLSEVEKRVGATLPASFRQFLSEFGGGSFGLTNICSTEPSGEYYLPQKQDEAKQYLPPGLIPVSDDHAGGLYVLRVETGHAQEPIFYWNFDGGLQETQFANVLEFVARYAYEPA